MVEHFFIVYMSKFTFEEADREMGDFVGLARSNNSNFCIIEHFGLPVVVKL